MNLAYLGDKFYSSILARKSIFQIFVMIDHLLRTDTVGQFGVADRHCGTAENNYESI